MKVLVLSASPRVGSNSDALANEFVHGAKDAGHEVEKVNLREKSIQFCLPEGRSEGDVSCW